MTSARRVLVMSICVLTAAALNGCIAGEGSTRVRVTTVPPEKDVYIIKQGEFDGKGSPEESLVPFAAYRQQYQDGIPYISETVTPGPWVFIGHDSTSGVTKTVQADVPPRSKGSYPVEIDLTTP